MDLKTVQSTFKDLMLDHPDALNAPEKEFAAQFETGRIDLSRRLKVYRNNIVGSLTDVVMASFPILEALVGQAFLEGAVRTFVLQRPPVHGCLNTYGAGFDEFLRDFPPAESLPYLPDVAALELAMNAAYYARDEESLTGEVLAAIPAETLHDFVPVVADHVELIESIYPLLAIKSFCEDGAEGTLNLDQAGVKLMIARPDLEVQIAQLEDDEFMALLHFKEGRALGEVVELVMTDYPGFNFQDFLQKHLALETFRSHRQLTMRRLGV